MSQDILYELMLWLLALAALPKMLYQRLVHKKYKKSLFKRFGIGFPAISKGSRKLIWIHAVSVGETKAVAALAKMLKTKLQNPILVISSTTETGHAEAERSIPSADYHVYLPLDFRWIIKPIVKRLLPDLVILVETDFWYNFLKASKEVGATVAVVNGKISLSSLQRFQRFPDLSRHLFTQLDLCCVQNRIYQERFEQVGMDKEKIKITGNMKFDEIYPQLTGEELSRWKKQLGIAADDPVLVAGSTHDPEEKMILEALQEVWKEYPNLKVMLVPRHPERFNEVAGLISGSKVRFSRLSELAARHNGTPIGDDKVILIDAMGVLRKCYQMANIAIVGGSFTQKVGGHNIIEPCWYGVPVLFGPFMHTQQELVTLVNQYHAGVQVTAQELATTLISYLKDPKKREELGRGGLQLTGEAKGATQKTWRSLSDCVLKTWE